MIKIFEIVVSNFSCGMSEEDIEQTNQIPYTFVNKLVTEYAPFVPRVSAILNE